MTVIPLFEHVLWNVCLYPSMCIKLNLVGADKLFEYVLRAKDYLFNS